MLYTVGEVAKKLKVAPSTLRYYDKDGLLPFVERSNGGIRVFTEDNLVGLSLINCLKQTGMSIKDIKKFIDMTQQGDETIDDRLEMFHKQRENVLKQIKELQEALEIIDYKCWFYENAKEQGTTEKVENLPIEELPEKYACVKTKMKSLG